jgi:pimeloyl-ACP methyl ester carboxylesterase
MSAPQQRSVEPRLAPVRHSRWAAALALGVGMAATAFGAGIGIRHLQQTGLTLETVTGLVVLAIGLALLGYAAVKAWRATHGWWRLTLVPAVVVVGQVVLSSAVAVMYTVVPPTALGTGTPADEGLDYRDVSFTTSDGVELSAWLIPSRNGAAVVLKHGAGSTRTSTIRHAGALARHGYGVLMVDARGHGRSAGTGMDIGWYGDLDTTAAVTFLGGQDGVEPSRIGVVGLSMGGEEAIGAAGVDPRISAVVAEGASGRSADDDVSPAEDASSVERGLDWWTYWLTDLLTGASPPVSLRSSVATAVDTEFLLIVAGTVEEEMLAAASMRSADPLRVQVWTVPGAGHTQGLDSSPEEWERRVVGFLDDELRS